MNFLLIPFTSVNEGEEWARDTENPFSHKVIVRVLEVKSGWVKYVYPSEHTEESPLSEFKYKFTKL